ncbi:hypothetical protein ES703_55297 [subsurface metagenome]
MPGEEIYLLLDNPGDLQDGAGKGVLCLFNNLLWQHQAAIVPAFKDDRLILSYLIFSRLVWMLIRVNFFNGQLVGIVLVLGQQAFSIDTNTIRVSGCEEAQSLHWCFQLTENVLCLGGEGKL